VDRPSRYLCSDCLNRLPFVPVTGCCRCCGREAIGLSGEYLCSECKALRPAFDRVASAWHFEGQARQMVNSFKFQFHYWLRADLVDALEGVVRARFPVDEIDLVLSMPSTFWHLLDRGYNQSAILAASLARRLKKPHPSFVLRRAGHPRRQGGLSEAERRTNAVGTFSVMRPSRVANRTVLVVDDIMTTGSTLSACAETLKAAGVERVWAVTLARSLRT